MQGTVQETGDIISEQLESKFLSSLEEGQPFKVCVCTCVREKMISGSDLCRKTVRI